MNTTRQTSIDCYNQIKAEGLLSKRRLETFRALMLIAPCTASEVQDSIDYKSGGRDCMKRISELRDRGVIYETGTRRCTITGRMVLEYDLTDRLPTDVPKSLSKKEKKKELLELIKNLGSALPEIHKADLRVIYNKTKLL